MGKNGVLLWLMIRRRFGRIARRISYFEEGIRKSQNNDQKSYSERKSDETELNGALVNVLRVLKVHELFFENPENLVWGRC